MRRSKKTDPRVLTKLTYKKNVLYELAKKYIKENVPDFKYTTMCLNKNLVCQPHKDGYNEGNSYIVGIGDYDGGNLYIKPDGEKEIKHNIRYNFLEFNGRNTHWNDDIKKGDKYSIVYFTL